ncbi:MAG TPA: FAD-binding oxidoreductase [Candidatus Baltobacteraceae bacterium]|nr:FAD-binding oxidoreductase [Candidatus Baltobacteraceae bacterium]
MLAGVTAGRSETPATIAEVQQVFRSCAARGDTLSFVGGGTELGLGNPPERADVLVRTERLNRIVEYAAGDMTITLEAGVTLGDLQRTVGSQGQRLALDPPLPGIATLGGLLATNAFGPRRTRFGTLRDLIVGVTIVRADGVVVRGGGKVVKNVAGFDLPKLMVGSLGTLGMIARATLRLHPLPEAKRWLHVVVESPSAVRDLSRALVEHQLEASAVMASGPWGVDHWDFMVLFEGFSAGVDQQSETFSNLARRRGLKPSVDGDLLRDADARTRSHGALRLRLSAPPAQFELLAGEALAPLTAAFDATRDYNVVTYPLLGAAFISGEPREPAALSEALGKARHVLEAAGGNLVVTYCEDPALVAQFERFGTAPGSFFLMKRLKERFDPERRLNRGRFLGGL